MQAVEPMIIRAVPEIVVDKNRLFLKPALYILNIDAKSLEILSFSASEFYKHYYGSVSFKS